ncbi:MAG: hypothetical protein ACJ8A6_15540 [Gemmatimonadales bacterium]
MVEYALILAQNGAGQFTRDAMSWASQVHWETMGYAALGLLALRIAIWVFRPSH